MTVDAPVPTASRSVPSRVNRSATFTVTIMVGNYGSFGQVVETLPADFTYKGSSLAPTSVETADRTVTFTLLDETRFTYQAMSPGGTGTHTFRDGVLKYGDGEKAIPDSTVRVQAPPSSSGSGGTTRRATSTPVPTVTPTPAPTATPQPTATATPAATATPMPTPEPGPPGAMGERGPAGPTAQPARRGPWATRARQGPWETAARREARASRASRASREPRATREPRELAGARAKEGDQGPPGPQGAAGGKGDPGAQGDTGPMGEQGGIGEKGPAGGVLGIVALVISILVAVLLGVGGVYIISRR